MPLSPPSKHSIMIYKTKGEKKDESGSSSTIPTGWIQQGLVILANKVFSRIVKISEISRF